MARRIRKYGLRPDLGKIVTRNYLSFASSPDGTTWARGIREFASSPLRVENYKRRTESYFDALVSFLAEHPYAFKVALDSVYSDIKKRAGRTVPIEARKVEVLA